MSWFEIALRGFAAVGALATLAVGLYVARAKLRAVGEAAVREEWKDLAEVRGERIDDLEVKLDEERRERHALEERVAKLEGMYQALLDLKVHQIADRVVERIVATRVEV